MSNDPDNSDLTPNQMVEAEILALANIDQSQDPTFLAHLEAKLDAIARTPGVTLNREQIRAMYNQRDAGQFRDTPESNWRDIDLNPNEALDARDETRLEENNNVAASIRAALAGTSFARIIGRDGAIQEVDTDRERHPDRLGDIDREAADARNQKFTDDKLALLERERED